MIVFGSLDLSLLRSSGDAFRCKEGLTTSVRGALQTVYFVEVSESEVALLISGAVDLILFGLLPCWSPSMVSALRFLLFPAEGPASGTFDAMRHVPNAASGEDAGGVGNDITVACKSREVERNKSSPVCERDSPGSISCVSTRTRDAGAAIFLRLVD